MLIDGDDILPPGREPLALLGIAVYLQHYKRAGGRRLRDAAEGPPDYRRRPDLQVAA